MGQLFHYKTQQGLLQNLGLALQNQARFITKRGKYYNMGHGLSQNRRVLLNGITITRGRYNIFRIPSHHHSARGEIKGPTYGDSKTIKNCSYRHPHTFETPHHLRFRYIVNPSRLHTDHTRPSPQEESSIVTRFGDCTLGYQHKHQVRAGMEEMVGMVPNTYGEPPKNDINVLHMSLHQQFSDKQM